jgi:hypothetical protein
MEMTKELIQTIDNCLNIDFKHGCFGISYGIIFNPKNMRQLLINSDGNLYPDIKIRSKMSKEDLFNIINNTDIEDVEGVSDKFDFVYVGGYSIRCFDNMCWGGED